MKRTRDPFDMFRDFDDIFNQMIEEIRKGNMETFTGKPFVYGFSMTQRPGEEPEIREFGNIYPERDQIQVGERRPLVDVFENDDNVQVIAEMPGIEKEDVELNIDGRILEISAARGDRHYREEVDLPADVDINTAKATYKNGVLEITLKKLKEKKGKKRIKVD